jgi:hypothetical protein
MGIAAVVSRADHPGMSDPGDVDDCYGSREEQEAFLDAPFGSHELGADGRMRPRLDNQSEADSTSESGESEQCRVERWRAEQLIAAGYEILPALQLAAHPSVDLHRACTLRSQGCPDELALQILL